MRLSKKNISEQDDSNIELLTEIYNANSTPLSGELKEKRLNDFNKLSESLETTARLESEKFDKGILSLSSIFLGFTLTFVDKIVPLNTAWYRWLLFISWLSFFFSILSILVGLLINQKAIIQLINDASKYFLEGNEDYRNFSENILNKWAKWLNYFSLFLFGLGAGTFIFFVIINLK